MPKVFPKELKVVNLAGIKRNDWPTFFRKK
jgi:hypothetical protein